MGYWFDHPKMAGGGVNMYFLLAGGIFGSLIMCLKVTRGARAQHSVQKDEKT
jgi:hypothetical protein